MTLHALGFQFDTDHSPRPPLDDSITGPLMRVDCGTGRDLSVRDIVTRLGLTWLAVIAGGVLVALGMSWWMA
jgi:hypothetical protein